MSPVRIALPLLALLLTLAMPARGIAQTQSLARTDAERLLNPSKTTFTENRGQIVDNHGALRPDILYKGTAGGIDIYFARDRVSYIFTKIEGDFDAFLRSDCATEGAHEPHERRGAGHAHEETVPLSMKLYRMDMELVGANPMARVEAEEQAAGHTNYYLGHAPGGIKGVRSFGRLVYRDIYPHIDMAITGAEHGAKCDFIVHPGGRVADIRLRYVAADNVEITRDGSLRAVNPLGYVLEEAPYSYQGSPARSVPSRYVMHDGTIGFHVGAYDRSKTLVIDPAQLWATFYGGTAKDYLNGGDPTEVDRSGNIYVGGYSQSTTFVATPGAFDVTNAGPFTVGDLGDAFIVKFDGGGNRQWATYFGGARNDVVHGIATDIDGNVLVAGHSESNEGADGFPLLNAHQGTFGGVRDAFAAKFDPAGALLWSTYYGGSNWDDGYGFAVDSTRNVAVIVTTQSTGLGTPGTFQPTRTDPVWQDLLIVKLDKDGIRQWATYYGGTDEEYGYAAATDINDNIIITGWTYSTDFPVLNAVQGAHSATVNPDAIVVKLDKNGNRQWATYYGGTGDENDVPNDVGFCGVTTDVNGNIFIGGVTTGAFPTTAGSFRAAFQGGATDAFIVKFDKNGVRQWGTYVGGSGADIGVGVAANLLGSVLLTGYTSTNIATTGPPGFPVTAAPLEPAFQAGYGGGPNDAFIVKLDKAGAQVWGTYFGAGGDDQGQAISFDPYGSILIAGHTKSNTPNAPPFAVKGPLQPAIHQGSNNGDWDGFISIFCDQDSPPIDSSGSLTFCESDSVKLWVIKGYRTVRWFKVGAPDQLIGTGDTIVIKASGDYYVRVDNNGGCESISKKLTATRLPRINPRIVPGPNAWLCDRDSVELTVTPAGLASFVWRRNGVVIPGAVGARLKAGEIGTYSVLVTDAKGCRDSAQVQVTQAAKPTDIVVTPSDTVYICEGSSATLTASGGDGGTISWVNGVAGRSLTVSSIGVYYAKSVSPEGCEKISNSVVVKVRKKPIPRIVAMTAVTFCEGDSAVLIVQPSGADAVPYRSIRWSTGDTTQSITVRDTRDVTVTVIDAYGCEGTSAGIRVTRNDRPKPKVMLTDSVICEGDSVVLSLSGTVYTGVLWSTGSTEATITVGREGSYWASVVNVSGCQGYSDTVAVRVDKRPTAVIAGPVAVCRNSPATYSVEARGGSSYAWELIGPSGTIASNPASSTIDVNWGAEGNNRVIVRVVDDSTGCSAADTLDVVVGSDLEPQITGSRSPRLCPGDSIILDAGPGFTSYRWSPGGETTRTIVVKTSGVYTVWVENTGGCSGTSKPYRVSEASPQKPEISAYGGLLLCPGDTVYLDVSAYQGECLWSNGNTIPRIPVTASGTFSVRVTDRNGCTSVSDPVTVTMNTTTKPVILGPSSGCLNSTLEYSVAGDPQDGYRWEIPGGNGAIVAGTGTNRISILWNGPGVGTVKVVTTSATTGCSDSTEYSVEIGDSLMPEIVYDRGSTQLCDGDTITLSASSGYTSYEWSNGEKSQIIEVTQPGTYTVTVADPAGCRGSQSITITSKQPITPQIVPSGSPGLCAGDSLLLTAPSGFASYLWSPNGETTPAIWAKSAGAYTVTVTDVDGCTGTSAEVNVTFFPRIPRPTIEVAGDTMIAIIDTIDAPKPAAFQWHRDGAAIEGATGRVLILTAKGTYTVTVIDSNGCTAQSDPYSYTSGLFASATVGVPVITAAPGEKVTIPVTLIESLNLDPNGIHRFVATLRFRNSLLIPLDPYPTRLDGEERVMSLDGVRAPSAVTGDLLQLRFIAALGDTVETPLTLETFRWTDGGGLVPVSVVHGLFRLKDLCETGGTRLLKASGGVALKEARPNPAGTVAEIEYEVVESGRTQLYLVNMIGGRVATLVDGPLDPGRYVVTLDAGRLSTGTYVYVLQTPTERLSRVLQVVR